MPSNNVGKPGLLTRVVEDLQGVESQLLRLGVTQQDLGRAITAANLSRADETPHSAKTYAGSTFYFSLIQQLRNILSVKGFRALSYQNIELVMSEAVAIAVCKGDEDTGNISQAPYSARKKGGVTLALFGLTEDEFPGQGKLFSDPTKLRISNGTLQLDIDGKEREVWILLHYSRKIADGEYLIKAELSRPSTFDKHGFINHFSERIILDLMNSDTGTQPDSGTRFTDDIDFDIE